MVKYILIITSFLFFFSCDKDEIKIENEKSPKSIATKREKSAENLESKPLIKIKNSDVVKIFVREDGAPGMFLGKDGKVHGFYVDLEKLVMEEIDQKYQFVAYSDVGPVVHGVKSGTHHAALAAPDLPEYRSIFNLSIPYELLNFVVFVQEGNTKTISGTTKEELIRSLFGKRIGVQTRGHIYQELRSYKEIKMIEYPTTTKALADLNEGKLDAVPDVKRIGIYYSKQNNWKIVPVGMAIISHKLTTAVSQKIHSSYLERYNKGLKKIITDGRLEKLFESYFGLMKAENIP